MKLRTILFALFITLIVAGCSSCGNKSGNESLSITPEAGASYKLGDEIAVKVTIPSGTADSIVYLVDSVKIASRKDTLTAKLKSDSLTLGSKLITARVYQAGKPQEVSTNIILLSNIEPEKLTYKVEKVYPHNPDSYTEGLEYHDGYLYESTGVEGHSSINKVDIQTGKTVQTVKIADPSIFGEGITFVGDKIVQLTYRSGIGYVYNKDTFKQISTFKYTWASEGWALAFDGKRILNDDKSNRIWFLNKDTYMPYGSIDVYDNKRGIDSLNELEVINGKIYSNVYTHDTILVINPKNGAVLQRVDMKNIWPLSQRPTGFDNGQNVLNGIAWDEKGKRLFVTGKKWPHLYQVSFIKK